MKSLIMLLGAMSLAGLGASVSRTSFVSLSIPTITVLEVPELGLQGPEMKIEMDRETFLQGLLVLPLVVKSNVPWAVTARVLPESAAVLVRASGGPEVLVGPNEVPILLGRSGKHGVPLEIKLADPKLPSAGVILVLRIASSSGTRAG